MELGALILQLMEEQNLSYRDMENRTGLSRSTINRYVKGKAIPLPNLELIATALGSDSRTMLGWVKEDDEKKLNVARKAVDLYQTGKDERMDALIEVVKGMQPEDIDRLLEIAKLWGDK